MPDPSQTNPQQVPQFSVELVIRLNAHALPILQASNDGDLHQRDLIEHDKGSTGIR